jgi:hypothetical protein
MVGKLSTVCRKSTRRGVRGEEAILIAIPGVECEMKVKLMAVKNIKMQGYNKQHYNNKFGRVTTSSDY